jgi:hypothetical protein
MLNFFFKKIESRESIYLGIDTFSGYPITELNKDSLKRNRFYFDDSESAKFDPKINLIKGKFQNCIGEIDNFLFENLSREMDLIVLYSSNLYSSTLFALNSMHKYERDYLAFFGSFAGDECRALYSYMQAYDVDVKILGACSYPNGNPSQLACVIYASKRSGP